jgi:hypothetical protein
MSFVRIAGLILCILNFSCYYESVGVKPVRIPSEDSKKDEPTDKTEALNKTVFLMESGGIIPTKETLDKVRIDITTTEQRGISDEPIVCQEYDYSEWFHSSSIEQGDVGACTIFASLGVIEAISYSKTGIRLDLSERDLFFQQYFGNSGVEEEAIDGLIWRSQASRTAEAATYDDVFKLTLNNGVCLEEERPYNEGDWITYLDLLKYNIAEMFYYIRGQMAEEDKHSLEIVKESKDELKKILLKGGEFRKLFKSEAAVSDTCRKQRDYIRELLKSYRAAYIDLTIIPGHEEKGRAILEALAHGPVAGSFGGIPGHAFVIYKSDCQDGKLSQLYIRDSDGENWKTTMQDLDENYTFWKIFVLVNKENEGEFKHTYGIQYVK